MSIHLNLKQTIKMESLFTAQERKDAKKAYNKSLANPSQHDKDKTTLIQHLLSSNIPDWNISLHLS